MFGLAILLLVSCTSTSKFNYDVDVQYKSENPAVSFEVNPTYSTNLYYGSGGFYYTPGTGT